ncbi:MAG: pyrimidine/purine nucleoside phosphorylase [Candidatus Sedimenticola sp. PURPLELP]
MGQITNVTVETEASIYFDGKCVSHGITLADGSKKSVGVIFPASLTFGTGAPEIMELVQGACRIRMAGEDAWQEYAGGEQFSVPGDSSFDIEILETMHYVCHYG